MKKEMELNILKLKQREIQMIICVDFLKNN